MSRPLPPAARLAEPDAALRQRALAAFILGALSLLGLAFNQNMLRAFYVIALTLVFAAGALWLGITVNKTARRSRMYRPRGAATGILLGALGLLLSSLWLLMLALFWPQLSAYSSCMNAANTLTTQQVCNTQLKNSISNEISILHG
jgi:hypothetical protein